MVSGLSVLTLILFGQVWFLGETYQQRGLEEKVVTSLTNMYLFLLLGAFMEIINVLLLDDIVSRNVLNGGHTITAFAGELVLGGFLLWLSREMHVRGQHRANVAKVPLFCWFAFLIYSPCQIYTCALVAKFAMPAEELMVIISIIHAGIISFVCTKHIPSFSVCLGTLLRLLRLLRLYYGLSVYYKEVDTFLWLAAVIEGILVTFILLVVFIATNVRYNMFKIAYEVLEENAEKDK